MCPVLRGARCGCIGSAAAAVIAAASAAAAAAALLPLHSLHCAPGAGGAAFCTAFRTVHSPFHFTRTMVALFDFDTFLHSRNDPIS